jgi:hypothetical protein
LLHTPLIGVNVTAATIYMHATSGAILNRLQNVSLQDLRFSDHLRCGLIRKEGFYHPFAARFG